MIILLLLTPRGHADFGLTLVALLGFIGMQAVYWIFTHPVNRFWLKGEKLGKFGSGFFSLGAKKSSSQTETRQADWTELRNRWEYSHVVRAVLAMLSLICLVITLSC